jgi:type IV pilus biogenesis protein PilP
MPTRRNKNQSKTSESVMLLVLALAFMPARPAAAQEGDPCPEIGQALSQAPDDLSKIQMDIDRFTLCVERAQLLKRLNDLATENEEALLGLPSDNPGLQLGTEPQNPPLPTFDRSAINPAPQEEPLPEVEEPPLPIPENKWVIVNIFGAGQTLSAKLIRADRTLAQVKPGDSLPDGARVNAITPTSVTLQTEDGEEQLDWLEEDQ